MHLKKLELFGFKSFADKTLVVFDQGVTCIVGPNGCGKSNISDAIRWVLGERSPKILRGSKMEDVIFNGTDFRKPIGFAEVSLTLDNADKTLPIDFAEVTITRRLHRSGESEYLINKTNCRLKDIYDLILDTGLGSSSYSMIEQGKIDYILNADPDERRFLIEEAAGISKYESKKDEAIRKLERTEENRTRLNDILHEVQKNIQYAERQAKRAQKYQEHFQRLKNLETRKAFYDIAGVHKDAEQLQTDWNTSRLELEAFAKETTILKDDQSRLTEILSGILNRHSEADAKRHQIQSRMDQNDQMLSFHREKMVEMAARRGQLDQEEIQLRERMIKSAGERDQRHLDIQTLAAEKTACTELLHQAEDLLRAKESESQEVRQRLESIKSEAFRIAMRLTQVRNDFHRLAAFLDTSEEQTRKQSQTRSRMGRELEEWASRESQLSAEIAALETRLSELSREKFELKSRIDALFGNLEERRKDLQLCEREIHETETQLKILNDIEAQSEITDRSFLSDESSQALARTLKETCEVSVGYEWAVEAALEIFSHSLVVDQFGAVDKLLERIRDKKPAGLGLLVSSPAWVENSEKTPDDFQHPLLDRTLQSAVQIQPPYQPLLESFFSQVYVMTGTPDASTLQSLLSQAQTRKFLFPDGTILGPHGRIFFRRRDLFTDATPFQRSSEIKRLNSLLDQKMVERAESQGFIENTKAEFEETRKKLETLESDLLESTIQKESIDSHRLGIQDRKTSLAKEQEILLLETDELTQQREHHLTQKDQLEIQLKVAEEEERSLRETQESLLRSAELHDSEKAALSNQLTEAKIRFQNFEDRLRLLHESVKLLESHYDQDKNRTQKIQEELAQLAQKESLLGEEDAKIQGEQSQLEKEIREAEVALELIRREQGEAEEQLGKSRAALDEIQQKTHAIEQSQHQFEMKKMDLSYQERTLHERLLQLYKISLAELKAEDFPMEEDPAIVNAEVEKLREKVEHIGTVNLLAIEEYDELKQRFDFLDAQMKDLEQARQSLLETIRQINRTTKGLFEQTFTDVQRLFQEYYQTLFRGGSAKLILTDEANPLESGIDIMVRPPGKKNQHISLLSGGEKALTCIALLFALYKIKPSPFCVLDEVDAPLDEANIDRFLTVLESFLKNSQFIIVTHNRKTIAMGNTLYGVTMQEAGISKIVSVRVNQDNNLEPGQTPSAKDSKSIEEQLQS